MSAIPTILPAPEFSLEELSRRVQHDPVSLVREGEDRYQQQLETIADCLHTAHGRCKVLLLAGPSASGKTTTAQKLSALLGQRGIQAPTVSLDDFFVGRGHYPRTPEGHEDFESVYGLDLERIYQNLSELIDTGRSVFPLYDFYRGQRREETRPITLEGEDILLVEGIHALNPLLSQSLPQDRLQRMCVNAATGFAQQGEELLSPADLRLVRRMIRDRNYRGYPIYKTLSRWESVLAGEQENFYPFQQLADYRVDSTIGYEPCLYAHCLPPHLGEEERRRHGPQVQRLLHLLEQFPPLPRSLVPKDSLLWEFIRGE